MDMTDEIDWSEILEQATAHFAASQLRRENPYAFHLLRVLAPYGTRGLRRVDAIFRVEQMREPTDLNKPKEFEKTVQSVFNSHNSAKLDGDEAIFHALGPHGARKWAVHPEKIKPWLIKKKLLSSV
jgi:hypothetical protein